MEENNEVAAQNTEQKSTKGAKTRKIFGIILDVILYLFLALSLFMLIMSVSSKKSKDGAMNLFGYEMRIVASSSMELSEYSPDVSGYKIKNLKVKSMIFIERLPEDEQKAKEWYSKLSVGDVLTFRYFLGSSQETITHRITEITPTDSGYIIKLQGDNRTEGATVSTQTIYTSPEDYPSQNEIYNYVIGKVVGNSTALGYMVYSVKQPVGTALIIIVPCSIIIVWQIIRIVNYLNEERKKKTAAALEEANRKVAEEAEQRESQAQEMEELKRKIAELEKLSEGKTDKDENDAQ